MASLNGRITRLEEQAVQTERTPERDPLDPIRRLVGDCLSHYGGAHPGCMGVKDSKCYTWAIQWPYVWRFHNLLKDHGFGEVPKSFDTAEEAQGWIEWTHEQLLGFQRVLNSRSGGKQNP